MNRKAPREDAVPQGADPQPDGQRDAMSTGQLADAVVHGTRWLASARVFTEVLLLATLVVLARLIPPAEFGKFAIVLFMQELAVGVAGGFGNALVHRPAVRREHLQAGLAVVLAFQAALVLVTVLVLAPVLFDPLFGSETAGLIQLAAPAWMLAAVTAIPQAVLLRRLDFRRVAQIQLASLLGGAAVSLALAVFMDLDAEALVIGGIGAGIVATVLSLLSAPVPLPRMRIGPARDLTAFGIPAALATISWAGFRNADYAIVGARLGAASAGIYWRAFQLAVEYQKKISVIMTQMAFPVLSRAASTEDMFALRLRMVRMLTVLIFPLLAGLVALAPVVIPWVFGPAWKSAVVPTQILTVAGAATLVIDAVGATFMAAGRTRALLGYGWAHFAVYAGTIVVVAPLGLAAVSIAAVSVHVVFLVVAYVMLLHGHPEHGPLRRLWGDVGPAFVSSLALLGVAAPMSSALTGAGVPASLDVLCVGVAAGSVYLLVLRVAFPAAWRDAMLLVRRVLPARLFRGGRPAAAVRGSGGAGAGPWVHPQPSEAGQS
jgi:O-antigen/teichoic acid export membrane protein